MFGIQASLCDVTKHLQGARQDKAKLYSTTPRRNTLKASLAKASVNAAAKLLHSALLPQKAMQLEDPVLSIPVARNMACEGGMDEVQSEAARKVSLTGSETLGTNHHG